jgi:acyl-CoA thioesterase
MVELDELLGALALEPAGEGRFTAGNAGSATGVVFGGQLMAQSIVAAAAGHEGKRVKTLHTVFARAGRPDQPLEIDVDPIHSGRAFASSTVTIRQGDRLCTRSQVLLSAEEPDLISHADPMPAVGSPDDAPASGVSESWQIRVVDGVDISDPTLVGPPDLDVWVRWAGAPEGNPTTDQALLAYSTDGFLIGTAMRPHEGVGQSQAHVTLATGVISHTMTFHRPAPAGEWVLLSQHSPFAGGGRSFGEGAVFTADGILVASFVQDAMIRPMG